MAGLLKGIGSLLPPNTIASKLATGTKISPNAIKTAISDVVGSATGTRGILGGSTPSVNLVSLIPGGGAVSSSLAQANKILSKANVSTVAKPTTNLGGISTLTPSNESMASAIAQQNAVAQSLTAGSQGLAPSNNTPVYQADISIPDKTNGIKKVPLDENGNPKKPSYMPFIIGGLILAYFLIKK